MTRWLTTLVRHLRTILILIPGDETCLRLVEADSVVADAFERAGLRADWIVEAVGLQAPAVLDSQRRK